MEFTYALKFEFKETNNEAGYEAVIAGLRIAKEMKIEEIIVFIGSQLVANQVNGNHNKKADALSKLASLTFEHLTKKALVEKLVTKSIYEKQVADVTTKEEDNWVTPIVEYFIGGILPADNKLARKIRVKALNYQIINGILYKRSFLIPWLRCVGPRQVRSVIKEIYEGSCWLHAGPRCRNEMGRGLAQRLVIVEVSHDLRGDSWGCVPRSLFWREDLDGDGECGFDCLAFALVLSKAHHEGCMASHGKNFKSYFLVMSAKDTIAVQRCGLSAKELNEFLSFYPIPSEYDVILPTSTQTIFDAPPGYVGLYTHSFSLANLRLPLTDFFCEAGSWLTFQNRSEKHIPNLLPKFLVGLKPSWEFGQQQPAIIMCGKEMAFRNFIYTKDDDDFAFLPKEPSPGFGTGSPSASVNTELPKDVEEPEVQPAKITAGSGESLKAGVFIVHPGSVAARIKERKCKMRGGSLRPPVKRKLAFRLSSSRAKHAKTSTSKDDAPVLSKSDDDEGLPDCFELKDANVYHLKISAITSPAWKGHLDNQIDLELLTHHDHDVIKARERSREEECEELRVKCKAAMAEFDQNPAVEELKQDRKDAVSKVVPHAAIELVHSNELGRLVGTLVSSAITYERCRAYEQVAAMKEPFNFSKVWSLI
ncbi:probable xyloglucan endotransglucosylase/hydrolase protein 30 [Tanacetum coccineum]